VRKGNSKKEMTEKVVINRGRGVPNWRKRLKKAELNNRQTRKEKLLNGKHIGLTD